MRIKEILGEDNLKRIKNLPGTYKKLCEAEKEEGLLENWKKLLEKKKFFVPYNVGLLNDEVLKRISLDELMRIDDLMASRISEVKTVEQLEILARLYSFSEIKEMSDNYFKGQLEYVQYLEQEKCLEYLNQPRIFDFVKETIKQNRPYEGYFAETLPKVEKFITIAKFLPTIGVVEKYPADQIEKFNKKIWFSLARNALYNQNEDAKRALVEAALVFGVFEHDEKVNERIGLLQKFATYIPKEIIFSTDEIKILDTGKEILKYFDVVESQDISKKYFFSTEKLQDPKIRELIDVENLDLPQELTEEEMEKLLAEEYITPEYKKIADYIIKRAYVVDEEKEYKVVLKKDLQTLRNQNKEEVKKLEQALKGKPNDEELKQKIKEKNQKFLN